MKIIRKDESARRWKIKIRRRNRQQQANEEETVQQTTKSETVNFVMNPKGCFVNGKPFDSKNPPDGLVIIADQKCNK